MGAAFMEATSMLWKQALLDDVAADLSTLLLLLESHFSCRRHEANQSSKGS